MIHEILNMCSGQLGELKVTELRIDLKQNTKSFQSAPGRSGDEGAWNLLNQEAT